MHVTSNLALEPGTIQSLLSGKSTSISAHELEPGHIPIWLTGTQAARIDVQKAKNKGTRITLSDRQIRHNSGIAGTIGGSTGGSTGGSVSRGQSNFTNRYGMYESSDSTAGMETPALSGEGFREHIHPSSKFHGAPPLGDWKRLFDGKKLVKHPQFGQGFVTESGDFVKKLAPIVLSEAVKLLKGKKGSGISGGNVYQPAYHPIHGSGFFSSIGNFFKKVYNNVLKPIGKEAYKVIVPSVQAGIKSGIEKKIGGRVTGVVKKWKFPSKRGVGLYL